ncbi:MAG: four helix bundle protein [candidate division WOR-3 bacterium]
MKNGTEKDGMDLEKRLKRFALEIMKLCNEISHLSIAKEICKQLVRSGTSPGANYREARRARSNSEFIAKIGIIIQELDESMYWLELLVEGKIVLLHKIQHIHSEANELVAIFTTISKKTKFKLNK